MSAKNQQDARNTPWDGFGASLLHDVGKIGELTETARRQQRKGKKWSHDRHLKDILTECFKKFKIPGEPSIADSWYDLIAGIKSSTAGVIYPSLKLADQVSKQIQGTAYSQIEDNRWLSEAPLEEKNKLRRDNLPTLFCPYFGSPKLWAFPGTSQTLPAIAETKGYFGLLRPSASADATFDGICRELFSDTTLAHLLTIQDYLEEFPHSRYVPHLSLKLHNFFSASIFYFAYLKLRQWADPNELTAFTFCTVEVVPNLLDVFYRLRDVLACSQVAAEFYQSAMKQLFSSWEADLPGVSTGGEPFVFYHSNGFVFLYPDIESARSALRVALNATPILRAVDLRVSQFSMKTSWQGKGWNLQKDGVNLSIESLPSSSLVVFEREGGQRCEACQRMVKASEFVEDDKGNHLCSECKQLRRRSSGIDIDRVSRSAEGSNRIAYAFVTLPDNLREHAAEVAEAKLIPQFWSECSLPAVYRIPATEEHVYEYLQALLAIRQLDVVLQEKIQSICCEHGQYAGAVLFFNPSSKVLVLHESHLWDFLEFVHLQKKRLLLECSVRAVICPPKTPFWSLVELATQHRVGDILWDVFREAIHMFSDAEIASIRNLADSARKYRIWRNQLNSLSSVALQTTLEELLLELDNRTDRLKELRAPLIQAIRDLKYQGNGSDLKDREKRAVFFKYIAGLTR